LITPAREPPVPFELRAALPPDRAQLLELARHLNTVNLPADEGAIAAILDKSERSFSGQLPAEHRSYVFLVRDVARDRAVGTSTLVAQLGRPDAPYIYFDVASEEKYSRDLGLHFEHAVLRLGFSYAGPTELAGLVVDPTYRSHPTRLGLAISYLRFLFIAAYPHLFQDELLAELLPPLEVDGTSHLWNSLGLRFTGMTYRQADRLSHQNKDFIRDLFPSGPVYASLLSEPAQAVIGKVGHPTRGVEKMLRRVGFRYAERVDPFDGGPHFTASVEDVSVLGEYRHLPAVPSDRLEGPRLLARLSSEPPYVLAAPSPALLQPGQLGVPPAILEHLGVPAGELVHSVPLP
jgi:arginine N-succinyltransferase